MKLEQVESMLREAGLDAEKARGIATQITPAAPAPTEAEHRAAICNDARAKLKALPALGAMASIEQRTAQALEKERLLKTILEFRE